MINVVTISGQLKRLIDFKGAGVTIAILENNDEEFFLYWEEELENIKKLNGKYVIATGALSSVRFKYSDLDDKERTAIRVRRIEGYDF